MKVNLGSGNVPLPGYVNVDLVSPADIVCDLLEVEFTDVTHVEMSHSLEHLPFRQTSVALERIHGWMAAGGRLRVEVPDCDVLCRMDRADDRWQQWMFGSQGGPGQVHMAGFTAATLHAALLAAGWQVESVRQFNSTNVNRIGYPCVEAVACA